MSPQIKEEVDSISFLPISIGVGLAIGSYSLTSLLIEYFFKTPRTPEMCEEVAKEKRLPLKLGRNRFIKDMILVKQWCVKASEEEPLYYFVQNRSVKNIFVTKKWCVKAVGEKPFMLRYVSEEFKTQVMCDKAVKKDVEMLKYVPNTFKTREMCIKQ